MAAHQTTGHGIACMQGNCMDTKAWLEVALMAWPQGQGVSWWILVAQAALL